MPGGKQQAASVAPAWAKDVGCRLLAATTTSEVNGILAGFPEFKESANWRNYGNVDNNWDRVGVQTSEPVGALAEVLINSIDAILMRKAREHGISEQSPNVPRNMREAVKRFFPEVTEGRLYNLSPTQRTELAEKCVLIAVKRGKGARYFPTYTIVDFGEGQNPGNFPKTLLSLGAKNKEGIPFVQGRFNMGSTGSITFCTRGNIRSGMYKFILSKRTLDDSDDRWGWTLIRIRRALQGEALPVAEYFAPNKHVPAFKADRIEAFGREDIGIIRGGTVVKLYEYGIGTTAHNVDVGLYNALTTSLINSALPIRLVDFDAQPVKRGAMREAGITARTFSGMSIVLSSDETDETGRDGGRVDDMNFNKLISENSDNPNLGTVRIYGFGVGKMQKHLRDYPYRVFYTINGQTQAKERASFFRKAGLDDLRNHLIVQVDCNDMDSTERNVIFKPDRERKTDNESTRELEKIIIEALKDDRELREYAAEIRKRNVQEKVEDDDTSENFFRELLQHSPELKDLFGMGDVVSTPIVRQGGMSDWKGKKYPTFLRPKNLGDNGLKEVPINSSRRVECETDAANDYLSRGKDPGEFIHPPASVLPNKLGGLRNGKLRVTLRPPPGAELGTEKRCEFGFQDSSRADPLTFSVLVRVVAAEPPRKDSGGVGGGVRKTAENAVAVPKIIMVSEDQWGEFGFDEESGATVRTGDDGVTIYVNADNRHLHRALAAPKSDEADREMCRHLFRFGVGILTFAMHKRIVIDGQMDENFAEDAVRHASAAIAAHVVTLVRRLGKI